MNENDWKISVEKKLTSIHKDIEYIKLFFQADDNCDDKHKTLKGHITVNRVLIGGLFTGLLTLTVVFIGKL